MDTSTEVNPVHTYNWGSFFLVCLTSKVPPTPTDTIQDTRCEFIRVAPQPASNCKANFVYVVDSATRTVTFHDDSQGNIDYWAWDFGDNSTAFEQYPVHAYEEPGYYQVHLQVRNTLNGCEHNYYDLVNAGMEGGLLALFTYREDIDSKKSDGFPVDFIGVTSGDAARFEWDFGDGSTNTTTMRPTHFFANPGTYHVCLYIEDPVTGINNTYCQDINTDDASYVGIHNLTSSNSPELHINLTSFPNPFSEHVQIVFDLPVKTNVELAVFDLSGSKRSILINTTKDPGQHFITWNGENLPSGIYLLRLITNNEQITKKLLINR